MSSRIKVGIAPIALAVLVNIAGMAAPPSSPVIMELTVLRGRTIKPSSIAVMGGDVLVMDDYSNRLFLLDPSGKVVWITGSIGDAPGQFYHPNAIATDGRRIVVLDSGNARVEILSSDGKFVSQFPIPPGLTQARSIALTRSGRIVINNPDRGRLLSIYDLSGKFVRAIGKLTSASQLYPGSSGAARLDLAANDVLLAADNTGNIWAAYIIAPVIERLPLGGGTPLRVRLVGAETRELSRITLTTRPGAEGMMDSLFHGARADFALKSICVDQIQHQVLVLDALNVVHELSYSGEQLGAYQLQHTHPTLKRAGALGIAAAGPRLFVQTLFVPGLLTGDFRARQLRGARQENIGVEGR